MKSLTEYINESNYRDTTPRTEGELKSKLNEFERDLFNSQIEQKELKTVLKNSKNKLGTKDGAYDNIIQADINSTLYCLAIIKAEQTYNQIMIDSIKDILKDMK